MKKYILPILTVCATLQLFSCSDDFLERTPDTQIPESQVFFNSETGLQMFSDGFYRYFSANSIKEDATSDNCEHLGSPADIRTKDYALPTALGSGGWDWTSIRNVNYFISKCKESTVESEIKNKYLGLARFFRAYLYFSKVKAFGDVPWYSNALNTNDDEELYKARDSRTLVMDSVLADLDFAIKYLPEEQYHNRISHWTALAFKSRICLYEGTWRKYHPSYNLPNAEKFIQESFNASKELVDKGPYKLYTTGNPVSDYRMLFLFTTASAEECILSLSFPQDQTGGGAEYNYFFTDYSNGNHGATRSLIEDYFMVDGTSFNMKYSEAEQETMSFADEMKNRDPRLAASIITPGYIRYGTDGGRNYGDFMQNRTGYQICKRVGPEPYVDYRDIILMRYAEVLLNYAEAAEELGKLDKTILDKTINEIRKRAGFNIPLILENITTDNHQRALYQQIKDNDVLCEIRHERRVELAFEGLRYDDIIRWGEGHLFRETYEGIYINAGINTPVDLDSDGINDVCFVREKPENLDKNLTYIEIMGANGFSKGDNEGGRIIPYNKEYVPFEDWEYLKPIPTEELTLNKNLKQNPQWELIK